MKTIHFSLSFFAALIFFSSSLYAGSTYQIKKDEGGLYMQTDQDGSWYITPDHIRNFTIGESGTYHIRADQGGTFIDTGKGAKYYINWKAGEEWEQEIEAFNTTQQKTENHETKVDLLDGFHILVPVTLESERHQIQARLLLDTGASVMVLHRVLADRLELKSTGKAQLMIAGGKILDSDMVRIDSVSVGPIRKKGLQASIIPHEGTGVQYQGLLGMNFLKGTNYRIDYDRQVIQWLP